MSHSCSCDNWVNLNMNVMDLLSQIDIFGDPAALHLQRKVQLRFSDCNSELM